MYIILKGYAKPTTKEIIDYGIRDHVATDWRDLGVQLLPDHLQYNLDMIKDDYPAVKDRCTAMFEKWLKGDNTASWNKLIDALTRISRNDVAGEILERISQGSSA